MSRARFRQDFDNFLKANQGEISKDLNAIADAIVRVLKEFEEWLTKGGGFKKIGDALESFGTAVKSVTDSMGGMQRAFEIFFLFWAGGKVIAAVELIGKLATSLALIGRLGVLAQIPFLGGDTNAPDPTPQQYKDAKAKEKAIIDGGGGFWSGVGKMFGFGGAPPAPAGGPPHAGVAPHAGGGAPPSAPAGAGAAINSGWGAVSNWWGANAPTWLGGNAAAGAAGANGVLPAPVGNNLPRNLRNKNPGNVIDGAWAARQPGYAGSDGHFAIFDTMENGYRAANKNVDSYASRGVRTPMQILNLWAPGSSGEGNDPAAYASSVQRKTGLDPNAPVGTDPDSRARMLRGITEVEAGRASPYTDAQISAALGGAPVVPAVVAQPPATVRTPGAFGFDPFGRAFAAPVQPYGGLQDYFHTPLGADGGGGGDVSHINAPQQTTIHIDGANDPSIVAHLVAANQSRIASDMARTLQGATQ